MKWMLLCLLAFPLPCWAQAELDTSYIQPISDENNVALWTTMQGYRINFQAVGGEQSIFQNRILSIGPRVKFKNVGVSLSLPLFSLTRASLRGSKQIGLGINFTPRSWYIEGTVRYLGGFTGINELRNGARPFIRTRDILVAADLSATHIFNSEKFSLPSALRMINRQKRSAASLILTFPAEYQYFQTDTLRLPDNNGGDALVNKFRSFSEGVAIGYAGSLVKGYWSLTGMYSAGIFLRALWFQKLDTGGEATRQLLSPYIKVSGSLVYNRPAAFFGLIGNYRPGIIVFEGLNTRTRTFSIQLVAGRRFL